MTPFPLLAAGLAICFGARFLSRRRRNVIRLRHGQRVELLSSVALLDGSEGDLLALEYSSELRDPGPEDLWLEARSLVQRVGARAEYATCRTALVSVRPRGQRRPDRSQNVTFTFQRGDSGSDWYPADGLSQ